MTPFYWCASTFVFIILKIFFRFSIEDQENLPESGPYVVAANHVSYLDPPVVGVSCRGRQVFFMAKKELFAMPILGPILRGLGSFPVDRENNDLKSLRHGISVLKEGKVMGIFPEGGRSATGELKEGEPGTGLLVKQACVPLVPCGIKGTYKPVKFWGPIPLFNRVTIKFGKPMTFEDMPDNLASKEKVRLFTVRVMEAIADLLK
jgi:1-acyl-sn-glycerol-3-phosphate acyltransferase